MSEQNPASLRELAWRPEVAEPIGLLADACWLMAEAHPDCCALGRLAEHLGETIRRGNDLRTIAVRAGFTSAECDGIMDGWDVAGGRNAIFNRISDYSLVRTDDPYWSGRGLGSELFRLYGPGHRPEP